MEMPIRIIIVLFVAVVVGGLVIVFSQQILGNARADLADFEIGSVAEDRIVELAAIDEQEVLMLANQCVRDYSTTFEEVVCYAVFTDGATMPANGEELINGHNLSVGTGVGNNFRISYSPGAAQVIIR